jgi:CspA family cold shock protein
MNTGIVVWFNEKQGFGFIGNALGGDNLFFHSNGDSLTIGQKVTFDTEINTNNGRPLAINVYRSEISTI